MSTFQKIIILGRLGQDPEKKTFPDGNSIVKISLATQEKWLDKTTGQIQTSTDWHKCQAYGKMADVIVKYCIKGDTILIEGKMKTRKFQSTDNIERWVTEVHITSIKLVNTNHQNSSNTQAMNQKEVAEVEEDNNIPPIGPMKAPFEMIDTTDMEQKDPDDLPF